jgi:hypothetical protein
VTATTKLVRVLNFMKVSFFSSIKNTSPKYSKDVGFFLDRIRNGASKEAIEKIRACKDKTARNVLKTEILPVVCFNGYFEKRAKNGIKRGSGLMTIDFDQFDSVDAAREKKASLVQNKCVFAVWMSPSNAVKGLLRIPEVNTDEDFKAYFKAFLAENPDLDESGSDISRACFESYDPEIYINLDAEVYEIKYKETPEVVSEPLHVGDITNIPVTDQNLIANRLIYWFKKVYDPKARNNSIFKLAAAFNDFGVDKGTALTYCSRYSQSDFKLDEIKAVIKSAYNSTATFGTRSFEDKDKREKLNAMVLSGKKDKEIFKAFPEIDEEKLKQEIEQARESNELAKFWDFDENGRVKINAFRFKAYLHSLNFYKHFPLGNEKTFVFIKKVNNFLEMVNEYKIKDKVISELEKANEINIFNTCANNTKLFTSQYLSMIDTAEVEFIKDEKDFAMIYYQNQAVKVFEDRLEVYDYDELDFHLWKDQVIKRDFIAADHHESMFRSFLWFISGQETARYNTMKSVIGYLLHSYKTSANNVAVILNDEIISETPNGGSGKGLLTAAIGHMKKVSTIDGKTFEFNKSFPYQTVSTDCQVLAFDDVKKNFDFEKLFSIITEGITIEYKGKDAIKLPVKDSPKVLISTNYTIKAEGGSFKRRMFEVELSSYFGVHHTPYDQFGTMLFDEWDSEEWARFDHFMINCLQYYIQNGLVTYEHKTLQKRKLINQTSKEFLEWIESKPLHNGMRVYQKEWFEDFINDYTDFKKFLSQRNFNTWLRLYFGFSAIDFTENSSNSKRYFELNSDKLPPEPLNTTIDESDPFA